MGNINKYSVKLYAGAYRDLDDIYAYIANHLLEPEIAEKIINALEASIFSLEMFPERGSVRRIGVYADEDYRQLLVKNYVIIYRILRKKKEVHIVTIRYAPSQF